MNKTLIIPADAFLAAGETKSPVQAALAAEREQWTGEASLPSPQAVQAGWRLLKDTTHDERSWSEDGAHENGCYSCCCMECGRMFTGHKRRVVCKSCADAPTPEPNTAMRWLNVESAMEDPLFQQARAIMGTNTWFQDNAINYVLSAPSPDGKAEQAEAPSDVVAFEFYNPATGHAIVDYSQQTHVGPLTKEMGYEARPLGYVKPPPAAVKIGDPVPLWQAREALDSLEESARGDAPYSHFAVSIIRTALEQAATQPTASPEQVEAPGARAVLEAVNKALDEQGVKGGWARRHLEDRVLYHLRATQPTASNAGERDSSYQLVGEVQTLHELNDSWIQHLPAGTPLYAKTRTNVGSDDLSDEDRAAMRFQLDEWVSSPPFDSACTWMPIESAPKDGTTLLLRSRKGRVSDGCWVPVNGDKGYWAWAFVNQEPAEWAPMLSATKPPAGEQKPGDAT